MQKIPSQKDLDAIIQQYKLGRFDNVEKLAILLTKEYPDHPFAWKALAVALKQKGKISEALIANKKVLEINPKDPEGNYNLANTLKTLNKSNEAINFYKKAISYNPNYAEAYNNLGATLFDQKKLEDSKIYYKKAIELKSDYFEAYNNLGITLKELGDFDGAVSCYDQAIKLKQNYAEAHNNLGIILRENGKLKDSENNFNKAIAINPKFAEAYSNLGILQKDKGELENSKKSYLKAIELKSDYSEAHYNLGITLRELGELENAEASYKLAIKHNPYYAEAYNNLGVTLRELCKLDESEAAYKRAIELKNDYPDAYNNLSFTLLLKNKFLEAYRFSEWRWQTEHNIGKKYFTEKPIWNGEKNKSVLVWKEQGVGDEIMYNSILPELKAISKKLIVYCDKRLIPLFNRSFSKDVIFESNKININNNDYDFHIPIGSMPRFFRKNLKSFNNSSKGYLKSDNNKKLKFRDELRKGENVKIIGISWNTKSNIQMASFRNIDLKYLTTELNNKNIKFVNLQYGDVSEEILKLKKETGIEVTEVSGLDVKNQIDDFASLVSACDIVVSIDNFTVHLAGSLGINTKILLPFTMDSRWGLKGKKSHLYNSVRLYRQIKLGNWTNVINELKEDIKN